MDRKPRHPAARTAARAGAVAAACVAAAWVHRGHDPGPLCPLRRLTGVPCPACGSTTAFTELGDGRWTAALAAQPVTLLATALVVAGPLGPDRAWQSLSARRRAVLLIAAAALSWPWQLHRFGFLG